MSKISRQDAWHRILTDRLYSSRIGKEWLNAILTETEARSTGRGVENKRSTRLRQFIVVVIFGLISTLLARQMVAYLKWGAIPNRSGHALMNLSAQKVKWDIHVGGSPICGTIDCHVTTRISSKEFERREVLPLREFPMTGYIVGSNVPIYYRTTIRLTNEILESKETIQIYSLFVWAREFQLYVDERLIATGGQEALVATLPEDIIRKNGEITVAIKVQPGDLAYQGISNYGDLLIAPQSFIAPLLQDTFHIQYTYPMIFYLPRVAFAALFCFLFLFMPQNREHFAFLCFAAAGAVKFAFKLDFGGQLLPAGVDAYSAFNLMYPIEQALLLVFIYHFFRKHQPSVIAALWMIVALLVVGLLAGISGVQLVKGDWYTHLPRFIKLFAMVYGCYLAVEAWIFISWSGRSRTRLMSTAVLLVFFAVGLCLSISDLMGFIPAGRRGFAIFSSELIFFLVFAGITALDMGQVANRGKASESALGRAVDSRLAAKMMQAGGMLPAARRHIAVLYCDIRNFTVISENLDAQAVFGMLNQFFAHAFKVIHEHHGLVDKLIGDCVMATWGAFEDQDDAEYHAAVAAVSLRKALRSFQEQAQEMIGEPLRIGVGVHCGLAAAGPLGDNNRQDYTVIGDTVNTASRLESSTKDFGADIIVSGEMVEKIGGRAAFALIQSGVLVKGRSTPVDLYQLLGVVDATGHLQTFRDDITARLEGVDWSKPLDSTFICYEASMLSKLEKSA